MSTGRFDYLDGLRAVAILAVLALHWFVWYVPFFHGGAVGVDVFFVLSGFIITTMLWRSHGRGGLSAEYRTFLARRVRRLYPALVGLVVGSIALYWLVPASGVAPTEVARRGLVALTQTASIWKSMQQDGGFWVAELEPFNITWSLAVEWYFYLIWPVLLLAAKRRGWTAGRAAALAAGAGAACYGASFAVPAFWFYFGPSARFGELLAGCALALWLQSRPPEAAPVSVPAPAAGAALAALCLYVVLAPPSDQVYALVGVPLAVGATMVLIVSGYGVTGGGVHALLSHPWMTYVGRLSYSLYLWHTVPLTAFEEMPGVPRPVLGLVALSSVAALTLASYHLLERPFMRPRGDVLSPTSIRRGTPGPRPGAEPRPSEPV
ncbi:acyltransferase family protein [Nocardioides deserti]|uniref:Acyltransferase n=1 Tax=Nocardioides deserti TaxID=1588644 RepID=A0ABR6U773_9ACTN|nr:acyltransferase [Nocardioides deserti]MBC2960291.1 acyltransferase [Nocardioides deserti]GGO71833.1 hypothetical protein GCM10012276_13750 [Nocardioides deserti]